jgi:hypothetical protein
VSPELTELRTVLSRSKTAYEKIRHQFKPDAWRPEGSAQHTKDERIKMLGDLVMVCQMLARYA